MIKEVKYTISWIYAKKILMNKKLWYCFKKDLPKTNQTEFRVKKVIRRKGDELYVNWKGYDNSLNS